MEAGVTDEEKAGMALETDEEVLARWRRERKARRAQRARENAEWLAKKAREGVLLDATAAETMLLFLSRRFGVRMPKLSWKSRRGHGHYDGAVISLSRTPPKHVVAHEFAHHLHFCRNGGTVKYGCVPGHDRTFYNCLKEVIWALGMWLEYPWTDDYPRISAWASADPEMQVRQSVYMDGEWRQREGMRVAG
jgi:hypothetical protein